MSWKMCTNTYCRTFETNMQSTRAESCLTVCKVHPHTCTLKSHLCPPQDLHLQKVSSVRCGLLNGFVEVVMGVIELKPGTLDAMVATSSARLHSPHRREEIFSIILSAHTSQRLAPACVDVRTYLTNEFGFTK